MTNQNNQTWSNAKEIIKKLGLYPTFAKVRREFNLGGYRERLNSEKQLYSDFIEAGDLCFDVGANVGRKTEAFLGLGARVVAFEPQPNCAKEIRLRCKGCGTFWVETCAVGREKGETHLDLNTRSGLARIVSDKSEAKGRVIEVPIFPLDYFEEKYGKPVFCKVDVEGHELEVLEGMSFKPTVMSLEYHTGKKEEIKKAVNVLEKVVEIYNEPVLNYTPEKDKTMSLNSWLSPSDMQYMIRYNSKGMGYFGDMFIKEEKDV